MWKQHFPSPGIHFPCIKFFFLGNKFFFEDRGERNDFRGPFLSIVCVEIDDLPAEDSKDEVEHEEGPDHDEGNKVDRVEVTTHCVVGL